MKQQSIRGVLRALAQSCFLLGALSGCERPEAGDPALGVSQQALTVPQILDVFSFERSADWQASRGSLASSTDRVLGNRSLRWSGGGYVTLQSVPVSPIGSVLTALRFRLKLPTAQPNPWWYGQTMVALNAPSRGINNLTLPAVELTGKPLGQFLTISINLPQSVRNQLAGNYADLRVTVILNVPTNSLGPYLLDDFRLFASPAPPAPNPVPDPTEILDFDMAGGWTASPGTSVTFVDEPAARHGRAARVTAPNSGELTSLPLGQVGPFAVRPFDLVSLAIRPASNPPGGAPRTLTLLLESAVFGPVPQFVGSVPLDGLNPSYFRDLSVQIPASLRATLQATNPSDLRLRLRFGSSGSGTSTYWLDRAAVGRGNRGLAVDPEPPDVADELPVLVSDDIKTAPSIKFPGKPRGPDDEADPEDE